MIILFKIQLFDQKILKNECNLFFFACRIIIRLCRNNFAKANYYLYLWPSKEGLKQITNSRTDEIRKRLKKFNGF